MFGPVHANVAFVVAVVAVSQSVSLTHGVLAVAVTVTVFPMVVTVVESEEVHPFVSVTVIMYDPAFSPVKELLVCGVPLLSA